jgi:hypothetical protein
MYPFIKRKSVVHKSEQKKAQMPDSQSFTPG